MQAHAEDDGVFIRSLATRGELGGLASATGDAVSVLDAAGFDIVLVETVGVGQDEVAVAGIADLSILVLVPGAGDDMQLLKAGIMEIGDLFVVNKADREGGDRLVASVAAALALDSRHESNWSPPVLRTIATTGVGVAELMDAIGRFQTVAAGEIQNKRRQRVTEGERAIGLGGMTPYALDHVAIAVVDPSVLVDFSQRWLGASVEPVEEVPAYRVRVRFIRLQGAALEIIEPTAEDSPVSKFLATRGPGLHHVALRVADLEATLRSLKARGVRLIDDTPRPGAQGTVVAFVHPSSTGGVLVELVERRS
jgi:LAO/AO transport system kinase